jgi:hypothetical protein
VSASLLPDASKNREFRHVPAFACPSICVFHSLDHEHPAAPRRARRNRNRREQHAPGFSEQPRR